MFFDVFGRAQFDILCELNFMIALKYAFSRGFLILGDGLYVFSRIFVLLAGWSESLFGEGEKLAPLSRNRKVCVCEGSVCRKESSMLRLTPLKKD